LESSRKFGVRNLILTVDTVLLLGAMFGAFGMHSVLRDYIPQLKAPPRLESYAELAYLALPVWIVGIVALGLHRVLERFWTTRELLVALLKLHGLGFLALSVVQVITQRPLNRSLIAVFLSTSFVLLAAFRFILSRRLRYHYEVGHGRGRQLLVGDPSAQMAGFLEAARKDPMPPLFLGYIGDDDAHGKLPGISHLGYAWDLERKLQELPVTDILFFPPFNQTARSARALELCEEMGIAAHLALQMVQPNQAAPRVLDIRGAPFITFEMAPKRPEDLALKHGFDALAAAVLLLLLSPLLLLVAAAILITMGRPLFFSQERAGLLGKPFRMYKFRTMVAAAEAKRAELLALNEAGGPAFKIARDPRITPLGRLLRKTSIDELPQLLNVLLGTMSLVGPRPLPVQEQKGIAGWHRRRLAMKPGLTGLAQVSGRSLLSFEDWMRLDLQYIDTWSLWLDLRLLFRTLPAVFSGRGAY